MAQIIEFPKQRRIVNPKVIELIKQQTCLICKSWPTLPEHVDNTKHDLGSNLIALCFLHKAEIHRIGKFKFAKKYPAFLMWLKFYNREDILQNIKHEDPNAS